MAIDDFTPFVIPLAMFLFGGDHTLCDALKLFLIVVLASGILLGVIGLNVGHHHQNVFHDGDPVRYVRLAELVQFS